MKETAKRVSIIVCIAVLAVALVGSGIFFIIRHINNTNATTESATISTNLFTTDGTINTVAANELLALVGYWNNTNNTAKYTAHNIAGRTSNNSGSTIIFPMGYVNGTSGDPLYWQATYLSGDYLSIWLSKCYTISKWGDSSSVTVSYDTYATSTIQAYIDDTFYPLVTQSSSTLQSIFATPKTAGYQTLKSGTTNDTSYYYSSSQTSKFDNMSTTVGNSSYMWLPSHGEVSCNTTSSYTNNTTTYTGQWGLTATDRAFATSLYSSTSSTTSYCFLRSGNSNNNNLALLVTSSGSAYSTYVNTSLGVRPAAHISLDTLATYVEFSINTTSNNSTQGSTTGGGNYNYKTIATITATPNSGYLFDYWLVGNSRIESNSYSFVVTEDISCVAYFKSGIIINATSNNSSYGSVFGAGTFESGDTVSLSAMPNTGYTFAYWQDSGGGTYETNPLTITASSAQTYTAYFIKYYTANITGTQTFTNEMSRVQNFELTYYLTAGSGYYFSQITLGSDVAIAFEYLSGTLVNSNCFSIEYTLNASGNELMLRINRIKADFNISLGMQNTAPVLKEAGCGGLENVAVVSTIGGSAEIVGDDFENLAEGDTITVVARLKLNGYQFDGWYVDDTLISTSWSARLTYDDSIKGKLIVAQFSEISANVNTDTSNTDKLT
ncbi:MAG: hypothetical protein IJ301_04120 [Clostridia bacterium]|nr:hypothetical protein [Clostridia bacterium]